MFFFKRGGEQTTELFKHDTYTIYTFAIDIYIEKVHVKSKSYTGYYVFRI